MSAAFVVDCSVAMAWLFNDEATPKTAALLNRLATETALVRSEQTGFSYFSCQKKIPPLKVSSWVD